MDEARRLARLSEKMMEFSSLCDNTNSVISIKNQKIKRILEQLQELMSFQTEEKRIDLKAACSPETLEKKADEDLLLSLLWNLVDNACKASRTGGRVEVLADGKKVLVRDFGKGIPEGEITHVTEAFYMG